MPRTAVRRDKRQGRLRSELPYYGMVLLPVVFIFIFCYIPMNGLIMAFQDYAPSKGILGSPFVGWEHFSYMLTMSDSWRVFSNTIVIALGKMALGMLTSVFFAVLLNEVRARSVKRTVQTIVYLPHFLSWVILGAVVMNMFAVDGPINRFLGMLGSGPVNFLGSNSTIQPILVGTDVWKEFGFNSVVYMAALTAVDPGLHEAATMDGAGWWRRVWHVTLPGILPIIMLMCCINLGSILNAGFDQVYNLYSPLTYAKADILDTYIFRVGLIGRQYSLGAAVGIVKSVVGLVLMVSMNQLAKRMTDQSVF